MMNRSRWIVGLSVLVGIAALLALFGGQFIHPPGPPLELPQIDMSALEPEVAQVLKSAVERVERQRSSAEAWGQLGHLLRAHGLVVESSACYASAEQLDPKDPRWPYLQADAVENKRPGDALPKLKTALSLCKKADSEACVAIRLRLAETLLQLHQADESEALIHAVLRQDPENARANFDLGLALLAAGKSDQSIPPLERATQSPFTRQKALTRLALVYQRSGRQDLARQLAEMANNGPEDLLWVDPLLAEYLEAEVGTHSRYAEAERLEQQGQLPQAAEVLRREASRAPSSRAFVALGTVLAKAGEFAEAEHALKAALEHEPDQIRAHYFLAVLKYMQAEELEASGAKKEARDQYQKAVSSAQEAIRLKPDHGLAQLYLGRAQLRLGDSANAITSLKAAVKCRPEVAEAHLRLGNALVSLNEKKEGIAELKLAAQLSPENEEIRAALRAAHASTK